VGVAEAVAVHAGPRHDGGRGIGRAAPHGGDRPAAGCGAVGCRRRLATAVAGVGGRGHLG